MSLPPGAAQIAALVRAGECSAREMIDAALDGSERLDPELGAFLHIAHDAARRAADSVDARRARGETLGALAGVPVAVKDNISTAGMPTSCGSRILEGYVPLYDAAAVERLRAADAVIIGKTNLDEFGMGSSGENSAFRVTRNPWDRERVSGGSSSGSAAAVAAGMVAAALGSDTGGSVRQPGSFCGVVGLKPTYGRVSRYGLVAFASSLDQIGILAHDVDDARLLLEVIAGPDTRDSTSSPEAATWPAAPGGDMTVGAPFALVEHVDPGVRAAFDRTVERLRADGIGVIDIELPKPDHAVAAYYVIAGAEASSNLARYDGVRYGERRAAGDLATLYGETRARGFGTEVKRRIMVGTYVLSSGYYDAYYQKAQRARTLLRRALEATLAGVDAILMPTAPTAAFRLGDKTDDPLSMYLADVFTIPASLAGMPALSVPAGFDSDGLPIGMQLISGHWQEETLFALARRLEALGGDELRCRPRLSTGERSP